MPRRPDGPPRAWGERERASGGAAVDFDDLWRHRALLQGTVRRIVGDAATAEDVVQETYVRVLANLHRIDPDRSPRGYLMAAARRAGIDELRRQARHARLVERVPEQSAPGSPEDGLMAAALAEQLTRALAALSDAERRALTARSGSRNGEAAVTDAARSATYRARRKLARAIDPPHDV